MCLNRIGGTSNFLGGDMVCRPFFLSTGNQGTVQPMFLPDGHTLASGSASLGVWQLRPDLCDQSHARPQRQFSRRIWGQPGVSFHPECRTRVVYLFLVSYFLGIGACFHDSGDSKSLHPQLAPLPLQQSQLQRLHSLQCRRAVPVVILAQNFF